MSGDGGLVEFSMEQRLMEGVTVGTIVVRPDKDKVMVLVANFFP